MNVKFLFSFKNLFTRKAPTVVQTVAKEVAPVVKKEPQIKFVPAEQVLSYLSPDAKEVATKYNAKVAFDKSKTYLSYRKNPNVHVRATYSADGRLIATDYRFADGRTLQTKGVAKTDAFSKGSSMLKDKDGNIIKKATWEHEPEVGWSYGSKPQVKTINTTVKEEFYKDGKLDHGRDTTAVFGEGAKNPIINGKLQNVDRAKNVKEYSIPAQRQVEYFTYGGYQSDKVFKTEPTISPYVQ